MDPAASCGPNHMVTLPHLRSSPNIYHRSYLVQVLRQPSGFAGQALIA